MSILNYTHDPQKLQDRRVRFNKMGPSGLLPLVSNFSVVSTQDALSSFMCTLLEWERFHSDEDDTEDVDTQVKNSAGVADQLQVGLKKQQMEAVAAAAAQATAASAAQTVSMTAGGSASSPSPQTLSDSAQLAGSRCRYGHPWRSQIASVVLRALDSNDSTYTPQAVALGADIFLDEKLPQRYCEQLLNDDKFQGLIKRDVLEEYLRHHTLRAAPSQPFSNGGAGDREMTSMAVNVWKQT